jgi:hypothetical protein
LCTMQTGSAMIDLPTIEGTASSPLPWGLLLLARLGDDHSIELQPGPLGSIEGTPTRSPPVGTAAAGPVGADHSIELQPGPLGSMFVHHAGPGIHGCAPCWPWDPWLCTMLAHGSMVVHHAGPVGDDRFADHRGNSNQVPSRGDCCCWPGRRSRELQPGPHGYPGGRCPTTGFLLPLSYFRFPTSQTHCERISERIANA